MMKKAVFAFVFSLALNAVAQLPTTGFETETAKANAELRAERIATLESLKAQLGVEQLSAIQHDGPADQHPLYQALKVPAPTPVQPMAAVNCTPAVAVSDQNVYIDGVVLNTISNTGSGTAETAPGYEDYTASHSTNLIANTAYSLNLTGSGTDLEIFFAWIDYDQDSAFSNVNDEYLGGAYSAGGVATINFTVPDTAASGTGVLRIISCDGTFEPYTPGSPPSACEPFLVWGESEDYEVNILNSGGGPSANLRFTEVVTPGEGDDCFGTTETIQVRITNFGPDSVFFDEDTCIIKMSATGENPITFTNVELNDGFLSISGDTVVSITTTYDMSAPGDYVFDGNLVFAPDIDNSDDTLSTTTITNTKPDVTGVNDTICVGDTATLMPVVQTNGVGLPANHVDTDARSILDNTVDSIAFVISDGAMAADVISVTIPSITHASIPDLVLRLVAPDSSEIDLIRNELGGTTMTNTVFTDTASTAITSANGSDEPFTGYYRPRESFSNLTGSANGTWYFLVEDNQTVDQGTFNGFTLRYSQGNTISTYAWSPSTGLDDASAAMPKASPTTTTTYTLTVTDANGCSNSASMEVKVNTLPTANAGADTAICLNDTVQLTATGGTTYAWSPTDSLDNAAIANPNAFPAATTTYTVTVTDANGCQNTDDVTVTIDVASTLDAGTDTSICPGASVQLSASGGASYAWNTDATLSDTAVANPTATPTVTTDYIVNSSNACGAVSDTVTVTVLPLPSVDAGTAVDVCIGDSVQLTASGASTYAWSPSAGLSDAAISNPKASPATTQTYTVTGTDANGCVNTDSVVVTVNPLPTAEAGNGSTICIGSSAILTGSGGGTYSWSPTDSLDDPNISNPFADPSVTTTYTLTVTDGNGCQDTDEVTVTVVSGAMADAGADTAICAGASVQLGASGGDSYSWSPSGSLDASNVSNPTATPTATTAYVVIVTNSCGAASDTVTVTINALPTVSAGADVAACSGDTTTLTASGASTYLWNTTETTAAISVAPTSATTYSVTGTDANGCTGSDSVSISITPAPTAGFTHTSNVDTATFTNTSSNATSYSWDFGDGNSSTDTNPVHNYDSNGVYTVTLIATGPCGSDTTTASVTIVGIGMDELVAQGELLVYPNPVSEVFVLNYMNTETSTLQIRLINVAGKVLYSEQVINFGGLYNDLIEMNDFAEGIYILELRTDTQVLTHKIIKE